MLTDEKNLIETTKYFLYINFYLVLFIYIKSITEMLF